MKELPTPEDLEFFGLADADKCITITLSAGSAVETVAFGLVGDDGLIFARRVGEEKVVSVDIKDVGRGGRA